MKGGGCGGKEDWDEEEGCGLCMKWQQQARRAYDPCPSPPSWVYRSSALVHQFDGRSLHLVVLPLP